MNGATVSVEADGERGEDRVAIALRPAVERGLDMLEAGSHRHPMSRQKRELRRAARKALESGKPVLCGKLAYGFHPRMEVERRNARTAFADFGNAQTDLVSHFGQRVGCHETALLDERSLSQIG
jgi:hypothetical protein